MESLFIALRYSAVLLSIGCIFIWVLFRIKVLISNPRSVHLVTDLKSFLVSEGMALTVIIGWYALSLAFDLPGGVNVKGHKTDVTFLLLVNFGAPLLACLIFLLRLIFYRSPD